MANNNTCSHSSCNCTIVNKSVCQTLSEMDWERGIWYAALNGDKEKIETIIAKAHNPRNAVTQPDNSGYTALHYAARNGHINICNLLLRNGAQVDAQTRSGKATPLQKAAAGGKIEAVKLLLQHGANVELQDDDGQTALHKAVNNKHVIVAEFLAKEYPNLIQIKDNKGNLAISL